jgi:hypothetical protein
MMRQTKKLKMTLSTCSPDIGLGRLDRFTVDLRMNLHLAFRHNGLLSARSALLGTNSSNSTHR